MKPASQKGSRLLALDIAKTFAILGVVFVHLVFVFPRQYVASWLAPIFVMLFLIVNGFTYALSLDAHGIDTFDKYYSTHLPRHLRSILWTYLVAFSFEVFYHSILITRLQPDWIWSIAPDDPGSAFQYYFRIREMMGTLFSGGLGPGAYYIPLLVQLALAFPVFYYPYRKHPFAAVAIYWAALQFLPLPHETRSFMTRLGYVIIGLVLYDLYHLVENHPNRQWGLLSVGIFLAGVLGMSGLLPIPYSPEMVALGLLAFLLWACQNPPSKNRLAVLPCKIINLIGGSTYHIYLAQKVFCSTRLPAYLAILHRFNDYALLGTAVALGLGFWFIDSRVSKLVFGLMDGRHRKN